MYIKKILTDYFCPFLNNVALNPVQTVLVINVRLKIPAKM